MAVFTIMSLCASIATAHAYVPPSFFVIRTLAKKHAALESGRFKSKVTFFKSNGDAIGSVNETMVFNEADRVTVRATDSSGNELRTQSRKLVAGRGADLERPVVYDLFYVKDGASIFEHFKALGLPLKAEGALYAEKEGNMPYKPEAAVALERFQNTIAVVIGSKSKEPQGASLWVEKDSFLPLRATLPTPPQAGSTSEPLDIRASNYQVQKSFLYPRVLQIFRDGALWAKIETQEVQLDSSAASLEQAPGKDEADGDLKEQLDSYFKWVR